MSQKESRTDDVLVEICIECGKEYMFDNQETPDDLRCEKCGNTVFRAFHASRRSDEAADDFHDSTDRDLLTTDPPSDVTRGDLHDLNNL